MTELAMDGSRTATGRPGFWRVGCWTLAGIYAGGIVQVTAVVLLGWAGAPVWGSSPEVLGLPFAPDGAWPLMADAGLAVALLGFTTAAVQALLRWSVGAWPAWHRVAAGLVAGGALDLAGAPGAGLAGAPLLVWWLVYRRAGGVHPAPSAALGGRLRRLAGPVVIAGGLAVAAGHGMLHPLTASEGEVADRAGRLRVVVTLANEGRRPVRVVAVEPGGAASGLHLEHVERLRPGVLPGGMQVQALLVLSRRGCAPGGRGRMDSIRVRYALAGRRSMTIPLERPVTASCTPPT